jgi:exodeoxyribonuclease VII small subunit
MTNTSKTQDISKRSFRDAHGVLQQHAETLRDQAEPNIDDLLTIVTESVQAYQVCKERIDAVEAALKAALDGAGVNASGQSNAGPRKERPKDQRPRERHQRPDKLRRQPRRTWPMTTFRFSQCFG